MNKNFLIENGSDLAVIIGARKPEGLLREGVSLFLCPVEEAVWNDALSPWPADAVFPKAPAFTGGADAYFASLLPEMIRLKESHSGRIFLGGYSLAGLFSLYICSKYDLFDGCISASGSLWYPGWTEWLKEHPVQCRRVYLSLGNKEKNTKNSLMKTVEEKTLECGELIRGYAETFFEFNEGGHFADENERLSKGLAWITK